MSGEELEAIAEFHQSLAYKVFSRFQENISQGLKESALELNDQHVLIKFGDQEHTQIVSVKEQLQELRGRQNQMIAERYFLNNVVKRYQKLKAQKSLERKMKRTKQKKIRT